MIYIYIFEILSFYLEYNLANTSKKRSLVMVFLYFCRKFYYFHGFKKNRDHVVTYLLYHHNVATII